MFDNKDVEGAGPAPDVPCPVPRDAVDLVRIRQGLAAMEPSDSDADAVDRIQVLEQIKAACAAAQARETVVLDEQRRAEETARGRPVGAYGRGVGGEVGLARQESPSRGRRRLRMARHLVEDMPFTLQALGQRRLAREAKEEAIRQDPDAAAEHFDRGVASRHITVKPARDGMAYLTALLPMAQAVACQRAVADHAATEFATGEASGRTPQQIMADALVERLTGQEHAGDTPVEIQLLMTDAALLDGEDTPAWLPGHGPMPAEHARHILANTEAEVFLRRLYTAPESGNLAAMDSRRRTFPALQLHQGEPRVDPPAWTGRVGDHHAQRPPVPIPGATLRVTLVAAGAKPGRRLTCARTGPYRGCSQPSQPELCSR